MGQQYEILAIAPLEVGGVLASVGRPNMLKRTVGGGWIFMSAMWGGMSKVVAVGTLNIVVGIGRSFDLEVF